HLLARDLGVEVDDGGVELACEPVEQRVDLHERRARDLQHHRATQVENRQAARRDLDDGVAPTGVGDRVVGGPDDPLAAVEVCVDLPVAVDVVAGGDHVDPRGEQLLRGPLGDSNPAGDVLAVGDHDI